MNASFLKLFTVPETRAKIVTTLLLLLVWRVGFQIPIPGMSPEFLRTNADPNSIFGLMSAFSGGAFGQTTVFALGIMPYISASIIFSMLTKVSPTLEAVQKEGASGQKKINQWTRLSVVPIAIVQAIFIYTAVFRQNPATIDPAMKDSGMALAFIVVLALTAGALVVMWLGELITEHGIGNGASLLIMGNIIASIPLAIPRIIQQEDFWQTILFMLAIWLGVVFFVVFIHKGQRRIPIQYARLTRGRKVYGGQRHFLPLKVNMAGVMPIIFASVIFVIPALVFSWLATVTEWTGWVYLQTVFQDQTGFVYVTIYLLLVFFFCFFWNRLMFQPEEIANNLREHGSFVPGIRPGARTAEYLSNVLTRITLAGAAFLAVIAVAPSFVTDGSSLPQDMRYFIGGTSVLIVVGVALELVDRMNALLVMRNYEGFMESSTGPGWAKGNAPRGARNLGAPEQPTTPQIDRSKSKGGKS